MKFGKHGAISGVGVLFLLPTVLFILWASVIPFVWTLVLSLQEWSGFGKAEWVGFSNFTNAFTNPSVLKALRNSVVYALASTGGAVLLGLFLATCLYKMGRREGSIMRLVLYSPAMLPVAVVGLMFTFFYNPTMGLVNQFLELIRAEGLTRVWLQEKSTAMPAIIVAAIWKSTGANMILCYAAMQTIPQSLFESSHMDGAKYWQQMIRITYPLIKPMILLTTINTLGQQYKSFGLIFTMTQGGPGELTTTIPIKMVKTAFSFGYFGEAAAMGMLLTAVVVLSVLATRWILRSEAYEL